MSRTLSNYLTLSLAFLGVILAGWLTVEHFMPAASLPCGVGPGGCESVLQSTYSHVGPIPTAAFGAVFYLALALLCIRRRGLLQPAAPAVPINQQASRDGAGGGTAEGFTNGVAHGGVNGAANGLVDGAADRAVDGTAGGSGNGALNGDGDGLVTSGADSAVNGAARVTSADLALERIDRTIWMLALAGMIVSWALQYIVVFVLQSFCPYCFSSAVLETAIFLLASRDHWFKGEPVNEWYRLTGTACALVIAFFGFTGYTRQQQLQLIQQTNAAFAGNVKNQPFAGQVTTADRSTLVHRDSHVMGSPKATLQVVEFGDYQCPNCKMASAAAADLIRNSGGRANLVFRNFPLQMHQWSRTAAVAAEAAAAQGKFWPMHDFIYQHQDEMKDAGFSPARFSQWARTLGLNVPRFEADEKAASVTGRVDQDVKDGNSLMVTSTPTFFVITPHSVWEFTRLEGLQSAFGDPNHPIWKG